MLTQINEVNVVVCFVLLGLNVIAYVCANQQS